MAIDDDEPPFVGGSQPVHHKDDPMPHAGRSAMQTVVIVIAVLAVLLAIAWIAVPMLTAD